jgi:hypothetical protein
MSLIVSTTRASSLDDRSASSRLKGTLIPRAALSTEMERAMFALLRLHFDGVTWPTFQADLIEKNWVIALEDDDGVLRGFSTILIYRTETAGTPITVVYSGDTIVERAWWGSTALPRTWIRAVKQLSLLSGSRDLYWLLLTSGYRTYRFLPVFFRSFYPRCDTEMPAEAATLRDAIALERFGSRYDPQSGLVRFQRPQVLAPDLVDVPTGRVEDEHVRFFLARNPGYVRGDELVCLTRIHDDNLTPAAKRMARGTERN